MLCRQPLFPELGWAGGGVTVAVTAELLINGGKRVKIEM